MGFTKKTWKNRIAEHINRRLLTMEDGSTNLVTVARDEGTISQEGDAFNAANMNDLEDRIEAGFEEVSQSLENCLKSVSDGKKTVANAITAQGVNTAADAEFATMAANIGTAGANKYNSGYSSGRTQGQNDVKNSPNSYGLYTKAQYDANKVTYKSGNYNTGLNGETWRSTSFNTGFSTIIALQINCWNDEGNGYFNAFKNVRISGGKVSLDFYAADYVNNYVQWLAVGK